ncbi:hypothetical protein CLAVI_000818 [Candidatus Clavichlamydia salmonicola]|uniref:hypothetical protein n=1 Tax=Candidatus Clavichlamydia salmonicola TaxID=469812 RepID=UPI001891774D|nr:hypothetical protein [Candidatus Clavichlamydia salmonicola]MBF5051180.1 hypothetical protein [Candidatus Clavichlamydia salmonicola]
MDIDRQELIKQIFKNDHTPAISILPPSLSSEFIKKTRLNKQRKSYGNFSSIKLCYVASNAIYHIIALLLQEQWRNVLGIEIQIEACEAKLFLDKRASMNYDLLISS